MSSAAPRMLIASAETFAELVAQLPAAARAQVAWTPKRIADLANTLLTAPVVTDRMVEEAGDAYLEACNALIPVVVALSATADPMRLVSESLQADLPLLKMLAPMSGRAAARALATMIVIAQLGMTVAGQVDVAELQKAAESLRPESTHAYQSLIRSVALLMAVFHGLRHSCSIPGRVAALARRADLEAQTFALHVAAEDPALQMPWYVANAAGAERVASFASWNPENQFSWRQAEPEPTPDEEAAWEQVKTDIDSFRPHRKLFG